jgi:signal transduction histidine kinase
MSKSIVLHTLLILFIISGFSEVRLIQPHSHAINMQIPDGPAMEKLLNTSYSMDVLTNTGSFYAQKEAGFNHLPAALHERNLRILIQLSSNKGWYFVFLTVILILGFALLVFQHKHKSASRQKNHFRERLNEQNREIIKVKQEMAEKGRKIKLFEELTLKQEKEINQYKNETGFYRDMLERNADERALELLLAKEKAEYADKLKTSFLANMSHEIRTPLNAIMGFLNLYYEEGYTTEEREAFRSYIEKSSKDLIQIIDDILDISRIEADKLMISNTVCDLDKLLSELNSFYQKGVIKSKMKVELIYGQPEVHATIITDPLRLRQILINLIDNALKFTEVGSVKFGYESKKDSILFYVKDTGIGISEDNKKIIFDSFTRVENHKRKLYHGTGIGLTLAKKLTELLGGRIWVESQIDIGSQFYFTLPKRIVQQAETLQLESQEATFKQIDLKKLTILIAEDEESNYFYLNKLLKFTGATMVRASTGIDATEEIKKNQEINLVLMDIKLPMMDGIEAMKKIKEVNPSMPIIALTAYAMKEDEEMMLKSGFDAYITKPVHDKELLRIIQMLT